MKKLLILWKQYSFLLLLAFLFLSLLDLRFALAAIICMAAPPLLAISRGRYWCGNLCPRGSFYDNLMSKISKKNKIPKFFKSKILRAIMVIFLLSMFFIGVIQNWGNPYGIGMVFYRIILITTVVGVILSLLINHRTWCQICPMGTLSALISKHRKNKKTLQVSSSCISCKLCSKKCPIGIAPHDYKGDHLSHPDCIQCGKCIEVCPLNMIGYNKINE